MAVIEYARCSCGGKHGYVPVFVPEGTRQKWCVYAWNAQFSECPSCKTRRKGGRCAYRCRLCKEHGWHKGRRCPSCADAPGIGDALDTLVVRPLMWVISLAVGVGYAALLVGAFLLTIPFTTMLGQWFIRNGFEVTGNLIMWPIPLAIVAILFVRALVKEFTG